MTPDIEPTLRAALDHHRAGRLDEAGGLYRQVLAADPEHGESLHRLGLIDLQNGRPEAAAALIERAVALCPDRPVAIFHASLAGAYRWMRRLDDAADHYRRALALRPDWVDACLNLGEVLREQGNAQGALAFYDRALSARPDYAEAHYNRGLVLKAEDRTLEAVAAYRAAIAIQPGFAPAHGALGIALRDLGHLTEAEASCREATRLAPGHAGAWNALGNVLKARGALVDGAAAYRQALALAPDHAEAIYNLGLVLKDQGQRPEAIDCFGRALALRPDMAQARFALVMAELPALYRTQDETEERREAYRARLQNLFDATRSHEAAAGLADGVGASQPFYLAYQGRDDRDLQSLYGGLVSRAMAARYPAAILAAWPGPDEPIRVGIVSGYFRRHANWRMPIQGWLSRLDRARFRLFGYHTDAVHDDQTAVAAALCERFVQGPLSTEAWRAQIAADAPHVLIYPEIGMDPMTVRLAAQRLAPVQCTSWGHPDTSGLPTIDFYLTSDAMEPKQADDLYTENLIRLPNLSVYLEPPDPDPREPAAGLGRADVGLREGAVVYWCGQSLYKYQPRDDDLFVRVAEAVADCQFVFIEFPGASAMTALFVDRLSRAFAARGLDWTRHGVVLPRLDADAFAQTIGLCDIVLDSLGWSGCNSLLDALPHALPIVTMPGALMRGRHGAAILERMAVRDTIAATPDAYVEIAVRLAQDDAWRAQIRALMAEGRRRLYRDDACIATLEAFLEGSVGRRAE